MSVSIFVVDDEPDVADLFRQCFRHEARNGTYVMHFANSGDEALQLLDEAIEPDLLAILSDITHERRSDQSGGRQLVEV